MKRPFTILLFCLLAFGTTPLLNAQLASDNHLVTVTVSPLTLLQVTGGAVILDVTTANSVAGQDQMTVTNTATQLLWGTNNSLQKVTVASSLASPMFTLQIEAISPTQGASTGPVTLTSVPTDFLVGIGRSSGSCTLRYVASVLASQGVGSDAHTITFTVQAQ